jgi:MFS family permease
MSLHESPAFVKMKEQGKVSKSPIRESFGKWENLKVVLIALFSINAGQAVTFYAAQFYVLFFLTQLLKMDPALANTLLIISVVIGAPFFMFFGWLSDKVGRKPVLMLGLLLATLLYFPIFKALATTPTRNRPGQPPGTDHRAGRPAGLHLPVRPGGQGANSTARATRSRPSWSSKACPTARRAAGSDVSVSIGDKTIGFDEAAMRSAIEAAGYPAKADPAQVNQVMVVVLIVAMILIATMTYGPLAAVMVELFPTRIRYTSMSLPYHIGNGWFGGFLPTVSFALVVYTGDIFYGLWYPVLITGVSLVVGIFCLKETKDVDIDKV